MRQCLCLVDERPHGNTLIVARKTIYNQKKGVGGEFGEI